MSADNFRFAPACFVSDPVHRVAAYPVLAAYDEAYAKRFPGKRYIPEIMKIPGYGQLMVYFAVQTSTGIHQVKVFSNN